MNATHWCSLCGQHVEPLWMFVPNTGRAVSYHLRGLARHAVTTAAGYTFAGAPGVELVELDEHGTFTTSTSA